MSPEIIIFFATKLHVIIVVMALVYVLFLRKQKRNQALLLTLFVLPASYIFGRFAGLIFNNPRPFVVDGFTPLVQHIADNGFPSDHTYSQQPLLALYLYTTDLLVSFYLS